MSKKGSPILTIHHNEKDKNKIKLLESRFLNDIYKFSTKKIASPTLIIEKNLIGPKCLSKN